MSKRPERPVTVTLKIGAAMYAKLKSEAMTYLLAHSGDSLDIVNAWGWIFRQIDASVQGGSEFVQATLGMRPHYKSVVVSFDEGEWTTAQARLEYVSEAAGRPCVRVEKDWPNRGGRMAVFDFDSHEEAEEAVRRIKDRDFHFVKEVRTAEGCPDMVK